MAVFVELTTDAFANTFNAIRNVGRAARRAGTDTARRPLRGLEIKDDTYAILKVIQADGTPIQLLDSGTQDGTTDSLTNFILQSVTEARMEKHQIVETFGEPYIFFFGESPRFLDVTAILVDSADFNWYAEFWENYNRYLRGTRSVEMGARTYLFYDDNIVEGYMLNASARKMSETPLMAQLTFRLYLTNYSNVTIADGAAANTLFPTKANYPATYIPPDATVPPPDPWAPPPAPPGSPPGQGFIWGNVDEWTGWGNAPQSSTPASTPFPIARLLNAITAGAGFVRSVISGQVAFPPTLGLSAIFGIADSLTGASAINNETAPPGLPGGPLSPGGPGTGGASGSPAANIYMPASTYAGLSVAAAVSSATSVGGGTALTLGGSDPPTPATPYEDEESDTAGQPDAADLFIMAVQQLAMYGADINDPATFAALGVAPYFTTPSGFGVFGAAGSSASFGVSGMGSLGSSYYGGINGGLGFVGTFNSTTSVAGPANPSVLATPASTTSVFGNGIAVQSGVVSGTGVGGGIPGGLTGGIGPGGPGTLPEYTGASLYAPPNSFSSSQGYGSGTSANGAAINVGGAPTAFSVVVVDGDLDPTGSIPVPFFIGPDGNFSYTNTTGVFV
jgi:hypothetical protein